MPKLYFIVAAVHLAAIAVTGMMWVRLTLKPDSRFKEHFRDIRAVHFGSLYLVGMVLGLCFALDKLAVPPVHWIPFPAGLGLLVLLAGVGWLFPVPPDVKPFYYWTVGWGKVFSLLGLAGLVVGLFWTAGVLVRYSLI